LRSDIKLLVSVEFDYVILDESQAIKNPASKVTRAASLLPDRRMAAFPKRWPEPADLFTAQLMPFWHGERTADFDSVTSSTGAIQLEARVAKPGSGRSVRISGLAHGK
jgi:hypothetical protein